MKALTVYEAIDGSRWDSAESATARDKLIAEVQLAMVPLGNDRPVDGRVYRQHSREACLQAKRNILAIVRASGEDAAFLRYPDDDIHPMGIAGRIITDSSGPLCTAWNRLMRINWDNFREYEQPYYALHPDEANEPERR